MAGTHQARGRTGPAGNAEARKVPAFALQPARRRLRRPCPSRSPSSPHRKPPREAPPTRAPPATITRSPDRHRLSRTTAARPRRRGTTAAAGSPKPDPSRRPRRPRPSPPAGRNRPPRRGAFHRADGHAAPRAAGGPRAAAPRCPAPAPRPHMEEEPAPPHLTRRRRKETPRRRRRRSGFARPRPLAAAREEGGGGGGDGGWIWASAPAASRVAARGGKPSGGRGSQIRIPFPLTSSIKGFR